MSHKLTAWLASLIATMSALVLSLLIASAKSAYDTRSNQLLQVSADIMLLDRVLPLGDLKPLMGLRWMTDPRTPALLLQAAVRLRPGWRLVRVLNPIVNLSASAAFGFRLSASGIALRARSRAPEVRFAHDSALERDRFEPSVPLHMLTVSDPR
jgi:hypothetical protein